MATCPRCREFLDENHSCKGLAAQTLRRVGVYTVAALLGAVAGGLTFGLVGEAVQIAEFEVLGLIAGPIAAVILVRAFNPS
jgi:hypothetical protein